MPARPEGWFWWLRWVLMGWFEALRNAVVDAHDSAGWAVSGPSEAARQWPMTTNDDHQARGPTASDQQKSQLTKIPGKTQGKKT